MSSSKLVPYKMKKGQWYEADGLTASDIAVIIDTNSETFWFWEGPQSSARNRSNAREILGQLRQRYISYRFKRINKDSSNEVKDRLEELQIHAIAKKKVDTRSKLEDTTRIFYILSFINSILVILTIILLGVGLSSSNSIIFDGHQHLSLNYNNFIFYIGLNSIITIISFILFISSAVSSGISRKRLLLVISIIGGILLFIPFLILRIWDNVMLYNISGQDILIRIDVLVLFVFCIDIFLVLGIICGILVSIIGLKKIVFVRTHER